MDLYLKTIMTDPEMSISVMLFSQYWSKLTFTVSVLYRWIKEAFVSFLSREQNRYFPDLSNQVAKDFSGTRRNICASESVYS